MKANILNQGLVASGKTTALRTLLAEYTDHTGKVRRGAGLLTGVISLDPGIDATLGPNICAGPTEWAGDRIHYHYIPQVTADWTTFRKYVVLSNTLDTEALAKQTDPNRFEYTQFLQVVDSCNNFRCDGCGKSDFTWDDTHVLVLDNLTGLTNVARKVICGASPFLSLPKIGHIQGLLETFADLFWGNTKCSAILLAHIEREISPLTGQSTLALSTIGQKLAPKLLVKPDEVILSRREGSKYLWDTSDTEHELKQRRLTRSPTLSPDYTQIFTPAS